MRNTVLTWFSAFICRKRKKRILKEFGNLHFTSSNSCGNCHAFRPIRKEVERIDLYTKDENVYNEILSRCSDYVILKCEPVQNASGGVSPYRVTLSIEKVEK